MYHQKNLKQHQQKKGLNKDLINKFSILNGTKYFSSGIFQNYLVSKKGLKKGYELYSVIVSAINHENLTKTKSAKETGENLLACAL